MRVTQFNSHALAKREEIIELTKVIIAESEATRRAIEESHKQTGNSLRTLESKFTGVESSLQNLVYTQELEKIEQKLQENMVAIEIEGTKPDSVDRKARLAKLEEQRTGLKTRQKELEIALGLRLPPAPPPPPTPLKISLRRASTFIGAFILSGIIALIIGYIFAIANNLVAAHEPMIQGLAIIASLIGGSYILSDESQTEQ